MTTLTKEAIDALASVEVHFKDGSHAAYRISEEELKKLAIDFNNYVMDTDSARAGIYDVVTMNGAMRRKLVLDFREVRYIG